MDIAKFISDLLIEHHEVSLPGIGTFFKKSESSYFSDGIFYPPSHKIGFKDESGSADTLVKHIISVKHISESSATYFIDRFCENLKSNLKSDETVNISPLGTLSKAEAGYSFEPSADWMSPEFFGLTGVNEAEIIPKARKSIAPVISSDNNQGDTNELLDEDIEEDTPKSSALWITVFLLVLAAGAVAMAYVYSPQSFQRFFKQKSEKPKPKIVAPVAKPAAVKDSVSFADSIVNALEKNGMHGSQVEKAPDTVSITTKATAPDTVAVKAPPAKTFEIIVASFGLRSEAERSARAMRKKGLDAKVVVDTRKPKFKVSIGSFTSSAAAHKENRRIKTELNPEAWVLTLNNK
jgi:hypothetical protein